MPPPSGSRRVFGQSMGKGKGRSSYQRQFGGGGKAKIAPGDDNNDNNNKQEDNSAFLAAKRRIRQQKAEQIDLKFGYESFEFQNANDAESRESRQRRGWLFNMLPTTKTAVQADAYDGSGGTSPERAGLELFFWTPAGKKFKTTVLYRPYFFILPNFGDFEMTDNTFSLDTALELMVTSLLRKYEGLLYNVQVVYKIDLDQPNHLSPSKKQGRPMLKLLFDNVSQLMDVRQQLRGIIEKNQARDKDFTFQDPTIAMAAAANSTITAPTTDTALDALHKDPFSCLVDMREYDVPYVVRVCTDLDIRVGTWYTVTVGLDETGHEENTSGQLQQHPSNDNAAAINANDIKPNTGGVTLSDPDNETKADPTFFAFDIECTKAPLKFPSSDVDEIFMISYMVSGPPGQEPQGYLIVSRSVVSKDVEDFEYTPMPKYPGPFHIFNEPDEKALLRRFFDEYKRHQPQICVTYNGDSFDFPYVDARAEKYGMNMFEEIGISMQNDQYLGRCSVHLDAFHWVQRDSYLPQGSQGLKAVTKYKLGYDPVEVDPEDMVRFAQERPVHMASYSVSDAVATFYLYEKYVHLFIFSLCTIIPMGPEDVLRKGSGTLCETLLIVQACQKDIICPNKQVDPLAKFHNGHLLESETYIGGKVECLETGVYRSDIEYDFDLKPTAFQELIDKIDRDLNFAIEVEGGMEQKDVVNYDEIRSQIVEELELLRDRPKRKEKPYVYHLDVGAMYPNIILTNRLQPSAMVNDADCAACDFNQVKNGCKRRMDWVWRGDYTPASKNDYERTKEQLAGELHDGVPFHQLTDYEQATLVSTRLKTYARMAHKKTKVTEEVTRKDVVCMRENDFYVETVRRFRDRRYELKKLTKTWKNKIGGASDAGAKKEAEDRTLVYDSLQVAHKCILNSFYGYVMRKGARWRSMEMAGIVTKTGADLITQARILVEQIGRPLELDTDGIWCILPKSFPDVYTFKLKDGSKIKLEYPCVMLNADVHANFTNHQYQTIKDPNRGTYETKSECSIFFEVDGPYRCMVLPASTEEGRLLKKRYAVFNFDGSLAELKGFELKRRGELELIKVFQGQVFERFLDGDSLEECYASVAEIANHWVKVLDTQGGDLSDDEVIELISENRNMSRQLDDYGQQKGTSQTTARRLGEFLGSETIKGTGLNCKFIIAEQPYGAPVTERAIPTAIWMAEPEVMKYFLKKWLKDSGMEGDDFNIRNILDWKYYKERLANTVRKIITIPAALQKIANPVPLVAHPPWLEKKVNQLNDRFKQQSITSMFKVVAKKPRPAAVDIEDIGAQSKGSKRPVVHSRRRTVGTNRIGAMNENDQNTMPTAQEQEKVPRVELSLGKENFDSWLKQKKTLWRQKRVKQKRLRNSGDATTNGRLELGSKRRKTASIEGFVRDAARVLAQSEWHVIEMHPMASSGSKSSGEMAMWVMVGTDSLQKIRVSVPRTVYVSARNELEYESSDILSFKRVEKNLPHGKTAPYVYEIVMPEYVFQDEKWTDGLVPVDKSLAKGDCLDSIFETGVPLINRALNELGCVSKANPSSGTKGQTAYSLQEISRVDKPTDGEYLHSALSYRRIFLYSRIHPKNKVGVVGVIVLKGGSGNFSQKPDEEGATVPDITRPTASGPSSFDVSASCHFWIVKPKSKKAQKNVSAKHCEKLFAALLETIHEASAADNDYACVSPSSSCRASSLDFVDLEEEACEGVNQVLSSYSKGNTGPTLLLVNSSKPMVQLRRQVASLNSFPAVSMPFPPGPAHHASMSSLPALNWEQPAIHICLEAFLYANVVSWPNRVSYARYGHIPVGNLGEDENLSVYDVSLSRFVQKNRTLSWGSPLHGICDSGLDFLPSSSGGLFPAIASSAQMLTEDEIWCDDDDLISPVVRRQGCYRNVCVDIDVHDIAIAALSDSQTMNSSSAFANSSTSNEGGLSSPNSVAVFDAAAPKQFQSSPLGDEMSTSVSVAILRSLVGTWLKDAFSTNSVVADELLQHVYRFVSRPDTLMHDPALHRVVHSLMKSTFLRLLGELQRLGCTIVHATFQKVTVATNKTTLAQAEEYINFVVSTIRNRSADGGADSESLSRVALRPRQFHSNFLFLDEYNFGTMHLDRRQSSDELPEFVIADEENADSVIVPSVVSGWSVMNYLGSELAQEYFRVIIGRFSKEILRKQVELRSKVEDETNNPLAGFTKVVDRLLTYKKKVITKHFASSLTRAVGEILKEENAEDQVAPPFISRRAQTLNPALEFIKNVIVVLELDPDVENEVQMLKRSLLAQVGVAEYASAAQWVNPCPSFMLPDLFCSECHESRDVNLCYIPPSEDDETTPQREWVCEDCGTPYDVDEIEGRLIGIVNKRLLRYQSQDLRETKTNRVVTRCLPLLSECQTALKLDISPDEARTELELLKSLADWHDLEDLKYRVEFFLARCGA